METKLILIGLILIFVPPICWYFIDRRRRFLRLNVVIVWLLGLFLGYPVISFAWAVWNIERHYDHNCCKAIELSEFYIRAPYSSLQNRIIAGLVGGTPRYYYLTTIIACELKVGNTKVALERYEKLKAHVETSSHDRTRLDQFRQKMDRLRERFENR